MANWIFDLNAYETWLAEVVRYYETSAPTVSRHANELYARLHTNGQDVTLYEIRRMQDIQEDGIWMSPHYAANLVYHLRDLLKMDTSGQFGF